MKKALLTVSMAVFLVGCASVEGRKDYFFIPVHLAESGVGDTGLAAFDDSRRTFENIEDLCTVAFYRGVDDARTKRSGSNGITLISTRREEIIKFHPSTRDFLLMKTGFSPGSSFTVGYFLGLINSYYESSTPNRYDKHIWFDIDKVEGDYVETSYALLAINTGGVVLDAIYVVDVLQAPMQYVGSEYAVKDKFLPLNVELANVQAVEHKLIEQNGTRVLVFKVIPGTEGILPGHAVEILVSVKIPTADLTREEYRVAPD